jgi:hypothetical protein
MRGDIGQAYDEIRADLALEAADLLTDSCRVIVILGVEEYPDIPCELSGNPGNMDGAPYRISFPWGSPAVIGAGVVVDAIPGRPQLTLQLVGPMDSSTALWQDWSATSGPAFGRVDVGL